MAISRTSIEPHDRVDFHMHTRASDGFWVTEQLVDHLYERGFRVAAICDHDTMESVPEAMERAAAKGIAIIPGAEMTTFWDGRQWHLLVYGIDPALPRGHGFGALLARQQDDLVAAAERAISLLEQHGHALPSLEEVVAGRELRPNLVLVTAIKDGHATNLTTAHQLVMSYGETLQVDKPLEEVVTLAHEAGGICVLAHPGRSDGAGILDPERLDRMLETIPVDGLEGHYRSYSEDDTARYRSMALDRSLLVSCGSDSHAPGVPVDPRPYLARWVVPFLSRLGVDVAEFEGPDWEHGASAVLEAKSPAS
jgi:predicted metal-dependent phosphoesterase TrpH